MTKGELRIFARNGWPVVQTETGAHGEIVYPYVREIKVIYASPEEIQRGYPRERLAAVLADRSGHSFTEVQAKQLRIPSTKEAVEFCLDRRADDVAKMCAEIDQLRER